MNLATRRRPSPFIQKSLQRVLATPVRTPGNREVARDKGAVATAAGLDRVDFLLGRGVPTLLADQPWRPPSWPLASELNHLFQNAFGQGGKEQAIANAQAETAQDQAYMTNGGPAKTEAVVAGAITKHWSDGHFYSQAQYDTQKKSMDAVAQAISNGSFKTAAVAPVVIHVPGTDDQVNRANSQMLGATISFFQRLAQVCGPDALCQPTFYFNASTFLNKYDDLSKSLEEPKFEAYASMVEAGIADTLSAVSARYDAAVAPELKTAPSPTYQGGLLGALADIGAKLAAAHPTSTTGKQAETEGTQAVDLGKRALQAGQTSTAE